MPVHLDVRFHRALYHYAQLDKWDFDPAEYPLLSHIRDGQSALLTKNFTIGHDQFYVDFINLPTLDVCTFPDPDPQEHLVFIGLTRNLVDELATLADVLSSSPNVQALIGIPSTRSPVPELSGLLFALALQYIVAHEVGHYAHGHIIDKTMRFEYSGSAPSTDGRLQLHADELAADNYAILMLCSNLLDGDTGPALIQLLPSDGVYGNAQLASLPPIAATAVFLLHLTQPRPPVDLTKDKHPPLVFRHHRIIDAMRDWLTTHGKDTSVITGARHHAIMQAVAVALPESLWALWNEQVDLFESPMGQQYFAELDKL